MKPEQFIREFGEKKAREVVEGAPKNAQRYSDGMYFKQGEWTWFWSPAVSKWLQYEKHIYSTSRFDFAVNLSDLKRLVESLDLVEYHGGFDGANRYLDSISSDAYSWNSNVAKYHGKLERAIAVHESIYGGGE